MIRFYTQKKDKRIQGTKSAKKQQKHKNINKRTKKKDLFAPINNYK